MEIRYPQPLKPGDLIAVTAPSSGVGKSLQHRLDFAVQDLRSHGFEVQIGNCMDGAGHISAPAEERAAELMRMLLDPAVKAVVPPWGGDTAIDLISLLDFETLLRAEPTWLVGYSDISTLLAPLTLLAGMATLHGGNLMDTPYEVPEGLMSWIEVASLTAGRNSDNLPLEFLGSMTGMTGRIILRLPTMRGMARPAGSGLIPQASLSTLRAGLSVGALKHWSILQVPRISIAASYSLAQKNH